MTCPSSRARSAGATPPAGSCSATTPSRPNATANSASNSGPWSRRTGTHRRVAGQGRHQGGPQRVGPRPPWPGIDDHLTAEGALGDHPTLGRWLGQAPGGRLVIDRTKVTAEARLDGKFLLSTADPTYRPRTSPSATSTCWSRTRLPGSQDHLGAAADLAPAGAAHPRPGAAVLAGLLLVRVAERQTASTWRRINTELAGCTWSPWPARLDGWSRPPPSPPPARAVRRHRHRPPPRVTSLQPA
jgi:hypothetical protein